MYPDEDDVIVIEHNDVTATLDVVEDDQLNSEGDENIGDGLYSHPEVAPKGIQQKFLWAVHNRLRLECSQTETQAVDRWLLRHLKKNNWEIRRDRAPDIAKLLKIEVHHAGYYKRIVVWLPDFRWGAECTPCCPSCCSNRRVRSLGFNSHHYGRMVIGLTENYYTISKRYICRDCEVKSRALSAAAKTAAARNSAEVTVKTKLQYTFMATNKISLTLLPHGYGALFPAFTTRKSAVDKTVLNMMRPLMDKGHRAESMSDLLLELHSNEYQERYIRYEYDITKGNERPESRKETHVSDHTFSSFDDKYGYGGMVPTGAYLHSVRILHHSTISSYLERELKKRDLCGTLAWDVSYKESKNLFKHKGEQIYKGLVTGMNHIGEVRVQFHVVTDSQEQFLGAIEEFKRTLKAYGHSQPTSFYTDNPLADRDFFQKEILSLREEQERFNKMAESNNEDASEHVSQQPNNERASQPGDKLYPYDPSIVNRIANTAIRCLDKAKRKRRCGRCKVSPGGLPYAAYECSGKGSTKCCSFFDDANNRRCGRCHKYDGDQAYECRVTQGDIMEGQIDKCEYFDKDGRPL